MPVLPGPAGLAGPGSAPPPPPPVPVPPVPGHGEPGGQPPPAREPKARRSGVPRAGAPRHAGHTVYATSGVYGAHAAQPPRRSRRGLILLVTSGVLALAVVAALLVVVVFKPGSGGTPTYGMVPTGSTAQQDGEQVAAAFLAAWQAGDLTKAGNYTEPSGRCRGRARVVREGPEPERVQRGGRQRGKRARGDGRAAQGERHVRGASIGRRGQRQVGTARYLGLPFLARRLSAGELVRLVRRLAARCGRAEPDRGHPPGGRPGSPDGQHGHGCQRPEPHPLRRPRAEHHRGPAEDLGAGQRRRQAGAGR